MKEIIKSLENSIGDSRKGLPDDIFYFVGRLTPFVNVDLLIKHPTYGILLTMRDDLHAGKGWHFPGGIIRFKESWDSRVREVAKIELNCKIFKAEGPVAVNQIIASQQKERAHFISLLFECYLEDREFNLLLNKSKKGPNKINFFKHPPDNLLSWHEIYRNLFIA
jgi:ADP-ribose pyrophosphatase YjhB (NUDIX family)